MRNSGFPFDASTPAGCRVAAVRRTPRADPTALATVRSGPRLARFCVALCHDVRGPVATAGAAIERLATLLAPDAPRSADDGTQLLEIARGSLARVEELLASLPGLLVAERRAGLGEVALEDIVRAARRDVELELDLAGGRLSVVGRLGAVLGHPERLRIALRNLLRNAVRYRRASVGLRIELRAFRRGPWRTLLVTDNGVGIPRAEQARVFAPLHRIALDGGPGSGLGLALARHAVEACGGTIALCSRPGRGASFAVTLRAAEGGG